MAKRHINVYDMRSHGMYAFEVYFMLFHSEAVYSIHALLMVNMADRAVILQVHIQSAQSIELALFSRSFVQTRLHTGLGGKQENIPLGLEILGDHLARLDDTGLLWELRACKSLWGMSVS